MKRSKKHKTNTVNVCSGVSVTAIHFHSTSVSSTIIGTLPKRGGCFLCLFIYEKLFLWLIILISH